MIEEVMQEVGVCIVHWFSHGTVGLKYSKSSSANLGWRITWSHTGIDQALHWTFETNNLELSRQKKGTRWVKARLVDFLYTEHSHKLLTGIDCLFSSKMDDNLHKHHGDNDCDKIDARSSVSARQQRSWKMQQTTINHFWTRDNPTCLTLSKTNLLSF